MSEATIQATITEVDPSLGDLGVDLPEIPFVPGEEPAPTPAPAAVPPVEGQGEPAPEGQEGTPAPETSVEVPQWLTDIPEADRRTVLESWLGTLSARERAELGPVSEILNSARQSQDAITRQRTIEETYRTENEDYLYNEAQTLAERISQGLIEDSWAELEAFEDVAAGVRQAEIGVSLTDVIINAAAKIGFNQIPYEVANAAAQTSDLGGAFETYTNWLLGQAWEAGGRANAASAVKNLKADEAVTRARLRNEVIGELAKEGRITINGQVATLNPDRVPPAITGGTPAPSGVLTDEELQDPQGLEAVMNDPDKKAQLQQVMREYLADVGALAR